MGDEALDQLVRLMVTKAELTAIEDWQFGNRVSNRSEAIRRLIALGLAASPIDHENETKADPIGQDAISPGAAGPIPTSAKLPEGKHGFIPIFKRMLASKSEVTMTELVAHWIKTAGAEPTKGQALGIVKAMQDLGWDSVSARSAPGATIERTFYAPKPQ